MTLSDGTLVSSEDPDADAHLAAAFGPPVHLVAEAPEGLLLEFAAGTLGGDYAETTELPLAGGAR